MRVGLILYGSLETVSGGYLYDRKLVEYLRNQGDHVELISLPWRIYLLHLLDNVSSSLLQQLLNLQVDALLQDELNHPSLFIMNERIRNQISYPIVSIVHHLRISEEHSKPLKWIYRRVEARYLANLDGMIYNSQTTQKTVEKLVAVDIPTTVACPAGDHLTPQISEEEIVQRAKRDGPLQLVFLGNVIPRKGLHTLIEALSLTKNNAFKLHVWGHLEADERYARRIQRRVAAGGLADLVTFHGEFNEGDLGRILKGGQVLVVPSVYEGYGIVYLEGMGFGLPAIASRAGGAGEIITHDHDGFLIEPGDVDGLLKHLNALHQDRELLSNMSLAAYRRFKRQPGWEQTGGKIRNYLRSIVRDRYVGTH